MNGKSSTSEFVIGLILGVVAGAIISLVLAPRSGKETIGLAKEKAADISDKVKELTADREKVYKETWKTRKRRPGVSEAYFE